MSREFTQLKRLKQMRSLEVLLLKAHAMVDVQQLKALREMTQAPLGDCREALDAAAGDIEKAKEHLRKKGALKAGTKELRVAKAGIIDAYLHPGGQIGVLLELRCETDFVVRSDTFRELAHELALQIAAMNPLYIDSSHVPDGVKEKETMLFREEAEKTGRPPNVIAKIVEGKLQKWYEGVCLLEQAFIKDENRTIRDLINEAVGKLGEKIEVGRFVRFSLK